MKNEFALCNLCKKKVGYRINDGLFWVENEKIKHDDITIVMLEMAKDYPKIKKIIIDMCPNCFKEKLIPWLEDQGAKIEEKDFIYE